MMKQAGRLAFWSAALAFCVLAMLPDSARHAADNCMALPDHPGAVVCGGQVASMGVALAAPAATVETIVAGPLSTTVPPEGIPTWMPSTCRDLWPLFSQAGVTHGISPALLAMVSLIESGCGGAARMSQFRDVIVSSAGAAGVMQIIPATAAGIAQNRGIPLPADWRTNAEAQIDFGAWLLAGHMRAYGKSEQVDPDYVETIRVSCIAYNGGAGAVKAYRNGRAYAESLAHSGFVVGMWQERHDDTSPTFERWRDAGGYRWLD